MEDKVKIGNKTFKVLDLYNELVNLSSFLEKSKSYEDYLNSFWELFENKKLHFKGEIKRWMILFNNFLLNPNIKNKEELLKNHNKMPFDFILYIPIRKLESYYLWFFLNYPVENTTFITVLKPYLLEEYEKRTEDFKDFITFYNYFISPKGVYENYEKWKELLEIVEFSPLIINKIKAILPKVVKDIEQVGLDQYTKDLKEYIKEFKRMKENNKENVNFTIFFPLYPFIINSEIKDLFVNQSYTSFVDTYLSFLDRVDNLSFYNEKSLNIVKAWLQITKYFTPTKKEIKRTITVKNLVRPQTIKNIRDLRRRYALLKAVEEYVYNVLLDDLGNFERILTGNFEYWEIYDEPFLGKPLIKLKETEVDLTYKILDKETKEFVEYEETVNFNFNYNYWLINLVYKAYKPVIDYFKKTPPEEFSLLRLRDIYFSKVEHRFKVILYEKVKNDPLLLDYLNLGIPQAVSTILQVLLDKHFEVIKEQMKEILQFYISRTSLISAIFSRFREGFSTISYVVGGTRTGKSLTAILFAELVSFSLALQIQKERKGFENVKMGDIIFSVWRHLIYNFRRLYTTTTNLNHYIIDEIVGTLHKSASLSKVQRRFNTFIDTQAVRRSILWLVLPQFSSISKEARSKGNFLLWKESREKLRIYYLIKSYIGQNDKVYSPKIEELRQRYFKFLPILPHNFLTYNLIEADGKNRIKKEISKSAEEMELSF